MKIFEFPPSPPVVGAIDRNISIADRERFDSSRCHSCRWVRFIGVMLLLMTLWANTAGAQGALTNGWTHTGTISPVGDSDSWTFAAAVGDSVVIRVGEITQTNNFTPRIRLLNPSSVQQATSSGAVAAEIAVTATNNGTFTVIVDDANGTTATGTYRLTLAKSPGAIFVAPRDSGGPLTNGFMHTGTIDVGDLDLWTFTANAGDNIVVRMGETVSGSSLTPFLRLYGPNGALLDSVFNGATSAEVTTRATNNGTFLVVVADTSGGYSGSGSYRLTLAKTGDPVVVSAGDDGGPLTNGVMHTGTIDVGDLDVWTFTANAGDNIVVRMGETVSGSSLAPFLRLYGPNGALLDSVFNGATSAEVTTRATNNGTFLVVVADTSGGYSGSGSYRLTLAKTGDPVVVSAGDDGGPLTNGVMHTGTIDVGDLDVWTFTANAGDNIVVRMGELVIGSSLYPWLRLYGPTGALLDSQFNGVSAAEVTTRATNSGTYLVVVADTSGGYSGSGSYRLTLAKTGDPVVVSAGDDGGPLTNGVVHTGTIDVGDLDLWTFTANAGDSIVVRMAETVSGSPLYPWLRIYGPTGVLLDSQFNGVVTAEVTTRATNSGTYLVVVADTSGGYAGSGSYRLTLAKTGAAVLVSAGDDGGPLTNGVMHTGTIDVGDLDLWTFTANAGDNIVVRMGEMVSGSTLYPWLRLYGPTGVLLDSQFNSVTTAEATTRATNSGTYLVVVADTSGSYAGSGTYRMTLAKTGDPVVISAGDEGGRLTNGVMHTGTIDVGDLDLWTFAANAGDNIVVRMGETVSGSSLYPWLRLYGPTGVLLDSEFNGPAATEVTVRATNGGTFLVVAADANGGYSGSGSYRLTLAKTGDPVLVSAGDDGGPLTNGVMHTGAIDVGDLDLWTFTANAGDNIVVRMGETVGGSPLAPWLRLYGPTGALLDSQLDGPAATEVTVRATTSGTFLVVATDGSGSYAGSGAYRLTLAKSPGAYLVSAGDEGGPLAGLYVYSGTLSVGDLDLWTFTACAGDALVLRMDELTNASPLTPWIRLYGRDGTLLDSVFGASTAQISRDFSVAGNYTVVVADASGSFGGSGGYTLTPTVNGFTNQLRFCAPIIFGTNFTVSGAGGFPNANFIVVTTTNIGTPAGQWTPLSTNHFDDFGTFVYTNVLDRTERERYFRLSEP